MKLGFVGLPLSGKTTVLNAVTGAHGHVGAFHKGPETSLVTVQVPDLRLDELARMFNPKKIINATIDYIDVPGVMADAEKQEYVQNLVALREADALVHVVRYFDNPAAPHPRGSLDVARDVAELHDELAIADLDVTERRIDRLEKALKKGGLHSEADARELALLIKCRDALQNGKPLADLGLSETDRRSLRQFCFLTMKPMLFLLNVGEERLDAAQNQAAQAQFSSFARPSEGKHGEVMVMCGKLENEIAELPPEERKEFIDGLGIGEPASARLVQASYRLLGLRCFFTVGSDEVKAWTIAAGVSALTAAGKIHTDIARGFIRAEVTSYADLMACGSLKAAKEAGKLRLEAKEYPVQDGDIITFRFHV